MFVIGVSDVFGPSTDSCRHVFVRVWCISEFAEHREQEHVGVPDVGID